MRILILTPSTLTPVAEFAPRKSIRLSELFLGILVSTVRFNVFILGAVGEIPHCNL